MSAATSLAAFAAFVLALLALDLKLFHRKAHEVKMGEAALWLCFWVGLALAFAAGVWRSQGPDKALLFVTAYLVEESLSVDNLVVFLVIFNYFAVPPAFQHRVLFWGIVGALVMRIAFISAGVAFISACHWAIYVFGAFLVFTGAKLALSSGEEVHPERNPVVRLAHRLFAVTTEFAGERFFARQGGRLHATPLVIALLAIETTDVLFALDSIPAVIGITSDVFLVYTSNVFAILGLRTIFFILARLMHLFRFLRYGLALILVFIGAKMILGGLLGQKDLIPVPAALGAVGGILLASVLFSLAFPEKDKGAAP